jgi:hypothetical protein
MSIIQMFVRDMKMSAKYPTVMYYIDLSFQTHAAMHSSILINNFHFHLCHIFVGWKWMSALLFMAVIVVVYYNNYSHKKFI